MTDRGCAPGRILGEDPCEALSATLGDTQFCELCDGDGCNSGSYLRASAVTVASLILVHVIALELGLGHGHGHHLLRRQNRQP